MAPEVQPQASSAEDVWTQLIGRADIEQAVAAALGQNSAGGDGLPFSYDESWPLSELSLIHI